MATSLFVINHLHIFAFARFTFNKLFNGLPLQHRRSLSYTLNPTHIHIIVNGKPHSNSIHIIHNLLIFSCILTAQVYFTKRKTHSHSFHSTNSETHTFNTIAFQHFNDILVFYTETIFLLSLFTILHPTIMSCKPLSNNKWANCENMHANSFQVKQQWLFMQWARNKRFLTLVLILFLSRPLSISHNVDSTAGI